MTTRHSAVSAFTETVEFLERSLASMLIRYCCSIIGCYFFLDIIGSQKLIPTYNTDRLLVAGNEVLLILDCITKRQFSMQLTDYSNWGGIRLKFVILINDSAATLEDLGLSS